ncbi:MAG: gliding motility-associated C-terminal domain-containing protein, partial [Bacteroidota bacterium]
LCYRSKGWKKCLLLAFLLLCLPALYAQQFINGSFEDAQYPCRPGLSNSGFTFYVPHTLAFGKKLRGLDHLDADCGLGPAADGSYFIGMRSGIDLSFGVAPESAIVGIELDRPLVPGNSYTVSFYVAGPGRNAGYGAIELGLTNENFQFGPVLGFVPGTVGREGWERRELLFVAPFAARYLTVRIKRPGTTFFALDNFHIECPNGLDLGSDTTVCRLNDWVLEPAGYFDEHRWQNGSTAPSLVVNRPGTYHLEARRDDCIVRDTITLEEFDANCDCTFYYPTAFSPNGDGINDRWQPFTSCEVFDYELRVYDRWGKLVYVTNDPHAGWLGWEKDQKYPLGQYVAAIRYRFSYQEDTRWTKRGIQLVR